MGSASQEILYLFNSASRPLYEINVLNVLAAPQGATTVHRYQQEHVESGIWTGGKKPQLRPQRLSLWNVVGRLQRVTEVVFVFVDRGPPLRYHPLRKGSLYHTWKRDGRLYLRVQWHDFFAAVPESVDDVSARIATAVGNAGPRLDGEKVVGTFVLKGIRLCEKKKGLVERDQAWKDATATLAQTTQFKNRSDRRVVFFRTELQQEAGPQASVSIRRGLERQVVQKNVAYQLRISYYDEAHPATPNLPGSPAPDSADMVLPSRVEVHTEIGENLYNLRINYYDKASAESESSGLPESPAHGAVSALPSRVEIHTEVGDNLQLLTSGPVPVEARADDFVVPLAVKRYADDSYSFVRVDVRPAESATVKDVQSARLNFVLAVREQKWFWPVVLFLVLVFAAAAFVLGVPAPVAPTAGSPGTPGLWPLEWHLPLKAAAALVQALALLALLRIIGKKPV
ncbi:hypothetical protein [Longimicrobium sp.]|uniref:hypothetical protein n=1 Tax=Longimicrobium sp. TaxID=2029185 RepID=UPI003B3A3727